MRLVSVSGTRGSGKTTLIGLLVERLTGSGKRCAVIVNESGKRSHKDFPSAIRGELPLAYLRGG